MSAPRTLVFHNSKNGIHCGSYGCVAQFDFVTTDEQRRETVVPYALKFFKGKTMLDSDALNEEQAAVQRILDDIESIGESHPDLYDRLRRFTSLPVGIPGGLGLTEEEREAFDDMDSRVFAALDKMEKGHGVKNIMRFIRYVTFPVNANMNSFRFGGKHPKELRCTVLYDTLEAILTVVDGMMRIGWLKQDIKNDNLVIGFDREGRYQGIKVIDFGLDEETSVDEGAQGFYGATAFSSFKEPLIRTLTARGILQGDEAIRRFIGTLKYKKGRYHPRDYRAGAFHASYQTIAWFCKTGELFYRDLNDDILLRTFVEIAKDVLLTWMVEPPTDCGAASFFRAATKVCANRLAALAPTETHLMKRTRNELAMHRARLAQKQAKIDRVRDMFGAGSFLTKVILSFPAYRIKAIEAAIERTEARLSEITPPVREEEVAHEDLEDFMRRHAAERAAATGGDAMMSGRPPVWEPQVLEEIKERDAPEEATFEEIEGVPEEEEAFEESEGADAAMALFAALAGVPMTDADEALVARLCAAYATPEAVAEQPPDRRAWRGGDGDGVCAAKRIGVAFFALVATALVSARGP